MSAPAAPRPLILFAHGAGAPSSSGWMRAWAARLGALGEVVCFDYPYMAAGRRAPDPQPRLVAAHREALERARGAHPGARPVILAGKSMGSRIGCHLALEAGAAVDGLVCFGYPLCGMGKREALRDEVLVALSTPILFLQGTRDKLCPLDLLAGVRERMRAQSTLHVVEGGDHSLVVAKGALQRASTTQEASDEAVLAAVERFVRGLAS